MEHSFEEASILQEENLDAGPPGCFWCSWNRRKSLFLAADRLGCSKVAFGHHADDIAHTTLLNLFYHGQLETMEPKVSSFGGRITVIRTLAYVPEKELPRGRQGVWLPTRGASLSEQPDLAAFQYQECVAQHREGLSPGEG